MALFELNEANKPKSSGSEPGTKSEAKPADRTPTQVPLPKPKKTTARPDTETRPVWRPTVTLGKRIAAGFIDLAVNLTVVFGVGIGLRSLGIALDRSILVPVLTFALSFSFLYFVFPLAFWGRTPGMARVDIVTRSRDGQSLSFNQAAKRWLGALLTLLTLGLPLLLGVKSGELLSDRLSGSQTYPAK